MCPPKNALEMPGAQSLMDEVVANAEKTGGIIYEAIIADIDTLGVVEKQEKLQIIWQELSGYTHDFDLLGTPLPSATSTTLDKLFNYFNKNFITIDHTQPDIMREDATILPELLPDLFLTGAVATCHR